MAEQAIMAEEMQPKKKIAFANRKYTNEENHRLVAEDGVMFGDYDEVDNLDIEDDLLVMMNEMHNA